jgi:ribosomal protein L7/L12
MPTEDQVQLAALKTRVFQLEAQVRFLYTHLGITYVPEISTIDPPDVIAALKQGNLIEAIKAYRLATNVGLAEAKTAVEEIRARVGL